MVIDQNNTFNKYIILTFIDTATIPSPKEIFMSRKCELTGKIPLAGHKVSHANNKVKRRFLPNLKKITFTSELLNKNIKLNVSNSALKSVDKKGGFDLFLKAAKLRNLSLRAQRVKRSILSKKK